MTGHPMRIVARNYVLIDLFLAHHGHSDNEVSSGFVAEYGGLRGYSVVIDPAVITVRISDQLGPSL